jgi:transposase
VQVKSAPSQGVRSVITARARLVEARVRLDNTIRGLCVTFGTNVGPGQGKDFVQRARETASIPGLGKAVASLLATRESLIAEIKTLDKVLNGIAKTRADCQILMSLPPLLAYPGGVQTSAAFAATVDKADRVKQSRATGAYFGLVPRRYQSGEVDWTGRITKPEVLGKVTAWCGSFLMKQPTPS